MNLDITALDLLPETDPTALAGLEQLGMKDCYGITCLSTCWITCLVSGN